MIAGTRTVIVGATVTAAGVESYSATTDSRGNYTIDALPGGYEVTASADGYNNQTFSTNIREGKRTKLDFALSTVVNTGAALVGKVTDASNGILLSGATVATSTGGYSAETDANGEYDMGVAAGTYNLTASHDGYQSATVENVSVAAGDIAITDFVLDKLPAGLGITSLTADPASFAEYRADPISLMATLEGTPSDYAWTQVSGPRVPLAPTDATAASADVSGLEVAAECELVFELTVSDADGNFVSSTVAVAVEPVDMTQYPAANVQIGGSTTAVARFQYDGAEWTLFNIGTALKATKVGMVKGDVYELILPGVVHDIEVLVYDLKTYALAAVGGAGVAVVDISNPASMSLVSVAPVNYYFDGVTFTDGGGTIWENNVFASGAGPVVALAADALNLYIGDADFGIHRTSLENVFLDNRETDGTLQIEDEVLTVQYAGERGWGGPISLKLYGEKLFAGLGALGMGIFDPETLDQVGRYNLFTDEARTEDFFGDMALSETVQSDGEDLFLDDFTGMPDYRQVNYEVGILMHTNLDGETPWADFEREGKWYYEAVDVDVAEQAGRTIAYIAYSLGGVVAVDVSGFDEATTEDFLSAPYLGYFVAVPANGPYDTGSQPASLLPYEGAGMLKESGVISVDVLGDRVFLTDHFAGLVILDGAGTPEDWRGAGAPFDNDTDDIPDNNVPEFEDVTSYDMRPWDETDNESLPMAYYEAPSELATRELNGHAYDLALMDDLGLEAFGQVDVLECSTGGGFVFVDVNLAAADLDGDGDYMEHRFAIAVEFPTTDEIGAAPDGTATEAIALGHTDGIAATENYLYVSDGPHGITAWNITDGDGFPTDEVHVVANTLQDEYPIPVGAELIYPASHTVRNVIDPSGQYTWALSVGNGLRRVPIADVEDGLGMAGAPLLMKLDVFDSYEHNGDLGVVDELNYQDQAYDVEFIGNYAYVADGTNGLTIYDTSKVPDPAAETGFFVANIGYNQGSPLLGTTSGIELWTNPSDGKQYAVLACGPNGVGVVDITDINNLRIVKVFEPIKYEDGDLGSADGQAIDVEVVGDKAYFGYDSFGLIAYSMADLVAPVPAGVDPTELFVKKNNGIVRYDYRPEFLGKFKLQEVAGLEDVDGGSVKMAYTQQGGKLYFYAAFGPFGVVKIDYTDPTAPVFLDAAPTASECVDVEIANGRLYVGDHAGGLVLFK